MNRLRARPKIRRYPRVGLPKGMLIAWEHGGERVVSRVGTLGLGGLFIFTPEPPPVGEVLTLFFEVPDRNIRARAIVRESTPGQGMGIEFTAIEAEARAKLSALLKRLLR